MSFSIIACIGQNSELGRENGLIFHLPEDMQFFRAITKGHKVLMGYNTWQSIGRPLKNRENFVLSRHDHVFPPEVVQIRDLSEFVSRYSTAPEEVFIIGGANVYRQFLPFAKTLYLTEVFAVDKTADVFFPPFDRQKFQEKTLKTGTDPTTGLSYSIIKYLRKEI
ncbi:dihydrofolate reductase [Candidatus Saccharibacteria bacterium]|nr:dihydrofolate reductase [Candidatus Saccharibacteria bacterium]